MSVGVDDPQMIVDDWNKKHLVGKKVVVTKNDSNEVEKNFNKFIFGLIFLLAFLWLVFVGIL